MPTTNSINLIKCQYNQLSHHFTTKDVIQGTNTKFLYLNGDPLLPIYLDTKIYVGLIDTGSNLSVIHSNVFDKLSPNSYSALPMPQHKMAVVANGQQISFQAYISTSIKIGNETLPLDLYVCDSINFEIIIGANFFADNNLSINFHTQKLEKMHNTQLFVYQDYTLLAHTKCIIYTAIAPLTNGQQAVFEPSDAWRAKECLLPRQLVTIDHLKPFIPVEITNCSDLAILLRSSDLLGDLFFHYYHFNNQWVCFTKPYQLMLTIFKVTIIPIANRQVLINYL
jgi:predicted aspartyl protease